MIKPRESWLPLGLSTPLGLLAVALVGAVVYGTGLRDELLADEKLRHSLLVASLPALADLLWYAALLGALLFFASCFAGLLTRTWWALSLLRKSYMTAYALGLLWAYVVLRTTGQLMTDQVALGSAALDQVSLFYLRWDLLWPAGLAVAVLALLHITAWRAVTMQVYHAQRSPAAQAQTPVSTDASATPTEPGDVVLENLRTHGPDPRFRKSVIGSFTAHLLVIVLIPWLLSYYGCVEDYAVPEGSGSPQVAALVKIVKPEKKPKKKFVLRPNSAIYFKLADLDDSELLKEVQEASEMTYTADPNETFAQTAGKLGAGGGTKGGWPGGMKDARVRFIRLQYRGELWDDGMDGQTAADINFLRYFQKVTGFNTAQRGESHPIAALRKYSKGYAPPFVYMTGNGNIDVPPSDLKTLRDYLLDGGMLFADAGSLRFDAAFRSFIRALLPGQELVTIADDDPIFQLPNVFPNGAPPLWHHGGFKARGVRMQGRWVVFYHPGDLNDAWKTGHTGMSPRLAEESMKVGVNIVYHAFTNYLERTQKYRK